MQTNVKKRFASHIYYGLDVTTGELRHISEVVSGKKCNCVCAACGQPMEARKGSERKHHFAHVSNYECMYASEVAIYKAFSQCIENAEKISLPPIYLRFPSWSYSELLSDSKEIEVDEVTFDCQPLAYPPLLTVRTQSNIFRVILDFGHYYENDDLDVLASAARKSNYALLKIDLPRVDGERNFSIPYLTEVVSKIPEAKWIYTRVEEQWQEKYYAVAEEPKSHGMGYLCPISLKYYKGKFSARIVDCIYCHFNIAEAPFCLCVAKAGIQNKDDFKRPLTERLKDIEQIRQKNEKELLDQEEKKRQWAQRNTRNNRFQTSSWQPVAPKTSPTDEDYQMEYDRICNAFNPMSDEPTRDKFGRRWVKCVVCGNICQDGEMAWYGGADGPNRGACRTCVREGRC